jgi:hypothetical protein
MGHAESVHKRFQTLLSLGPPQVSEASFGQGSIALAASSCSLPADVVSEELFTGMTISLFARQ